MRQPLSEPLLSPYVAIDNANGLAGDLASPTLRDILRDRAIMQAKALSAAIDEIKQTDLPVVLQTLGHETSGFLTRRVRNMLTSYLRILQEPQHADVRAKLSSVFWPIEATVGGQLCVTTPALLEIDAIVFCDIEWFHGSLFEAHSAARAHTELRALGFPETHAKFIAALIAHQTLLRASWGIDRGRTEVEAFRVAADGCLRWVRGNAARTASERDRAQAETAHAIAVGQAIARTLFPFVGVVGGAHPAMLRNQVAASLVLHSLCVAGRNTRRESAQLTSLKEPALDSLDHLLSEREDGTPSEAGPFLFFSQYAQYTFDESEATNGWGLLDCVRKPVVEAPRQPTNLTLCFPRVASREVWRKLQGKVQTATSKHLLQSGRGPIWTLIQATVGDLYECELAQIDHLYAALGITASKLEHKAIPDWLHGGQGVDAGRQQGAFEAILLALSKQYLSDQTDLRAWLDTPDASGQSGEAAKRIAYLPAPLVGRVLQCMSRFRPSDFAPLQIVLTGVRGTPASDSDGSQRFSVWLPRRAPTENSACDELIARYVAAMVISHLVNFGPRSVALDYFDGTTREEWSKLIEKVVSKNGGPLMRTYVEQVRCEPVRASYSPATEPKLKATRVLGIDIGGSAIKLQLINMNSEYRIDDKPATPSSCSIDWKQIYPDFDDKVAKESSAKGIPSLAQFFRELLVQAEQQLGSLEEVAAAGIAIPAPVREGVTAGISGPMAHFQGFTFRIWEANPQEIHSKLDFAAALQELRPNWTVVCMNDGDADLRSSDLPSTVSAEGVTVVLKLGTGLALGVHVDGREIDLLSEAGKTVINLLASPNILETEEQHRFPTGVLGDRCSKKAFEMLNEVITGLFPAEVKDKGTWLNHALTNALNGPHGPPDTDTERYIRRCAEVIERRQLARIRRTLDETACSASDLSKLILPQNPPDAVAARPTQDAVRAAHILGGWVADAITQMVDLHGANEVRLAGGPLSGVTGVFVAVAAESALREVYGFDVTPLLSACATAAPMRTHPHPRGIRQLRLVYPPERSDESGPRGVAKAAIQAHERRVHKSQLRLCRDEVMGRFAAAPAIEFAAEEVMNSALKKWPPESRLIGVADVEAMLETESASLGLTRLRDGTFKPYRA